MCKGSNTVTKQLQVKPWHKSSLFKTFPKSISWLQLGTPNMEFMDSISEE